VPGKTRRSLQHTIRPPGRVTRFELRERLLPLAEPLEQSMLLTTGGRNVSIRRRDASGPSPTSKVAFFSCSDLAFRRANDILGLAIQTEGLTVWAGHEQIARSHRSRAA